MPFTQALRVRYHEVDMQRVVFNAHYLAYCDEACSSWLRAALGWQGADDPFDWMLVKAVIEWQGSATFGDELAITCSVPRWGTTSWDMAFVGTVGDRPIFTATITYVCVVAGTTTTQPVPDALRLALSDPA